MKHHILIICFANLIIFSIGLNSLSFIIFGESLSTKIIFVDGDADSSWYDANHVKTINEAVQNATEGDTIYVYSGLYYENITIIKSLSLIGEDQHTTIIDGYQQGNVITIETSDVSVSGFTIQNASNNDIWEHWAIQIQKKTIDFSSHLENFTVSQCIIKNNQGGILIHNVTNCQINNCTISNNSYTSLAIRSHSNNIYIDNLSINYNGNQTDVSSYYDGGVTIDGYNDVCSEITIIHCKINDNIGDGIDLNNAQNISTVCSCIEKNSKFGMSLTSNNKNITIQQNIISENKWNGIYILDTNDRNGSLRSIQNIDIRNNTITTNGGGALPKAIDGGILIYNCFNGVHIINNNITSNTKYGIYFAFSRNNNVLNNNFINNTYNAYFSGYSIWNKWDKNYWDNWIRFGPKIIKGNFGSFLLPWYNFDWRPASEPYTVKSN